MTQTLNNVGTDLTTAIAEARAELGRVDAKAGSLLATAGVLAALVGSLLVTQLPTAAAIVAVAAVACFCGSTVLLLLAIRPRLPRLPGSLADNLGYTAEDLLERFADPEHQLRRGEQLIGLSKLAVTKFQLLRPAGDLLVVGIGLLVVALAVSLLA